jgi:anti-sigma B factor antagonist
MRTGFDVQLVDREGALWVAIAGELDLATAPLLEEKLAQAEISGESSIVIDLSAVTFIDSSGLRALLDATARSLESGDRLRITEGSAQVNKVFELTGVHDRLRFV